MKKLLFFLDRLTALLTVCSAALSCAFIFLMAWLIVSNVLMRLIFNSPIAFVEEYSGFAFVFLVFMGLAWATRTESHIEVTLLYSKLPTKVQNSLAVITSILSLAVVSVYFWFAFKTFLHSWRVNELSVITNTPFWIPKLLMCIGIAFFGLEVLIRVLKTLKLVESTASTS